MTVLLISAGISIILVVPSDNAVSGDGNSPPSVTVVDPGIVPMRVLFVFSVSCTDLDPTDPIRLTWMWGDGNLNVTNHQSNGGGFAASAEHRYYWCGVLNLTVWIDDLTGLPGHNVSDWQFIAIRDGPPHGVYFNSFTISNRTPFTMENVTFSASLTDTALCACLVTFVFGDGNISTLRQAAPSSFTKDYSVVHNYSRPGVYLSHVEAVDPCCPPTVYTGDLSTTVHAYYNLSLSTGWNLVSIPLVDHGYNASTLPLNKLDLVCGWNATKQGYDSYIVGVTPPTYDFVIEEGTSYWINTQTAKTLQLRGRIPETPQYRAIVIPNPPGPEPVPPPKNWAFIGFAFSDWTGKRASDIPSYFDGTVDMILRWSKLSQTWKSYVIGVPPSDFPLLPGEGYIIRCSSGTLYFGP